jgi:hypothetical protein
MLRLRPLSEEECYLRCYGWVGTEDAVRVLESGVEDEPPAVVAERIRREWERRLDQAEAA